MRQDLTIQRIGDSLAVRTYEAAARAALQHGDLPEYNQCQARLMALYRAGTAGCQYEFLAYRIFYQLAHAEGGGNAALVSSLKQVSDEVGDLSTAASSYPLQRMHRVCVMQQEYWSGCCLLAFALQHLCQVSILVQL